jgi:ABC-type antimicrobial peptide transport system permease subunit
MIVSRILAAGSPLVALAVMLTVTALFFGAVLLATRLARVPLHYNVRNLLVRWPTTALTALAFTLVVGLMTIMLSFVNGMYALTKGSAVPGNVMILQDGSTDEVFSDIGFGDISLLETDDGIKSMSVEHNGQTQQVKMVSWELYQIINQPIPNPRAGRLRRFVQMRGIEDPVISGAVHDLELYPGGAWFDPGAGSQPGTGDLAGEQLVQAVVGEGLAREMGPDQGKKSLEIGDVFELGARHWIIVGIMKSSGKTFDSEVWAKRKIVGTEFRKDTRSTAVVRIRDGLDPAEEAQRLRNTFTVKVNARTETEYFDSLNAVNQVFLGAIIFVTIFIAVGGVFGVMNTMFAAIAQRTRDIGVLRILGFARWRILVSFFVESLLLALVGGLVGCALGSLCHGWTATSIIGGSGGGGKSVVLKLVVNGYILGGGLLFSLLLGSLGGLLPALSAIRLKPLEALR